MGSPNSVSPIRHLASPVREQVVDYLRAQIVSGALREGQRLIERELCEQLDVSRNTLREAYRQLEAEGFVELKPHKGPAVRLITRREAQSIYELREALEGLAIRLFTQRASDEQVTELQAALRRLREVYGTGDIDQMLAGKNAFYEILYSGADNELLRNHASVLQSRLIQLRAKSLATSGRPRESLKEVSEVVKLITKRDAEAAEAAWCRHIRAASQVVDEALPTGAL